MDVLQTVRLFVLLERGQCSLHNLVHIRVADLVISLENKPGLTV